MSDKFHFSPRENRAYEIYWREWDEEAFKEAKEKDKLVLLSISAVWCHWCHVMDETAYSYKPNINLINDEFMPIRVDNDKNPDVNSRYNMGGWPTTVILTPEGEILNGGTYMPDKTLYSFLANTSRYYKVHKRKGGIINKEDIEYKKLELAKANDISDKILTNIDKAIYIHFDSHFGGFGVEPKFPHEETLDYLIFRYFNNKEEDMFKMITKTLDSMANGGIYDHEEGGFFRYSTTRDWSIPHYEKMLEDNSKLLDVYLKLFQITNEGKYSNTCSGIIDYMNNSLLDIKSGVFWGSQDADEYYYSLTKKDRKSKEAPFIDKTIYTDWNAMAISAYIRAYYVIKDANCLGTAQRAVTFLIKNCFSEKHGMYHYYLDEAQKVGLLDDQTYMINALIDLYEVTSDNQYIYNATNLADLTLKNFYDDKNGGFFDDIVKYDFAPMAKKNEKSIQSNSFAAQVFYRLYDFSTLEKYKKAAEETIFLFGNAYESHSFFASSFGKPVLRYLSNSLKVTIVGDINNKKTSDMTFESLKLFIPFKNVEILDVNKDGEKIILNGYSTEKSPSGYVCKGESCLNPVFTPHDIINLLENNLMQKQ